MVPCRRKGFSGPMGQKGYFGEAYKEGRLKQAGCGMVLGSRLLDPHRGQRLEVIYIC